MELYLNQKSGKEFSETRGFLWKGWEKLKSYFENLSEVRILDIGCGNSRFINWLNIYNIKYVSYLGIDYSDILLNIAKSRYSSKNIDFKNINLLDPNWVKQIEPQNFNFICSFGVTHHLETEQSRIEFFDSIYNLLDDDGICVISFWQFVNTKLISKSTTLGENLYLLPFGKEATRVCYHFDEKKLEKYLSKFRIIDEYYSDSKDMKGNRYFVLSK